MMPAKARLSFFFALTQNARQTRIVVNELTRLDHAIRVEALERCRGHYFVPRNA